MANRILKSLKGILGTKGTNAVRPIGHGTKTILGATYYGFPSRNLTIIGVTGTKGKTSTTTYIGRLLNEVGIPTGYISTAVMNDGSGEIINPYKMTSLDGLTLQKTLKQISDNGCTHVVVELSSQGMAQNRHWGLGKIDIGVFLNIFPEHLESHGGWDNYLNAKAILFKNLDKGGSFVADGRNKYSEAMWNAVPHKQTVNKVLINRGLDYSITKPIKGDFGFGMKFEKHPVPCTFNAEFEVTNMAFALRVVSLVKGVVTPADLKKVPNITGLPGRMEWVLRKKKLSIKPDFKIDSKINKTDVLVDYAHEPESMKQLLTTLKGWKKAGLYDQVIHILSCDGAGRDDWKKPVMGDISYAHADRVVLTTDNYSEEDDPRLIVDLLAKNYPEEGMGEKYIKVINRKKAFQEALKLAISSKQKTLIVSTGVGSEYGLTQPGGTIKWDETQVWTKLIEVCSKPKKETASTKKSAKKSSEKTEKKTKKSSQKTSSATTTKSSKAKTVSQSKSKKVNSKAKTKKSSKKSK